MSDEEMLAELIEINKELKELIDYHKKRAIEEGFETLKLMSSHGDPYFQVLLAARSNALLALTILLRGD